MQGFFTHEWLPAARWCQRASQVPRKDDLLEGESGLIHDQGYALTNAKLLRIGPDFQKDMGNSGEELRLVRLFNPWEAKEWTGAWSDG